MSGTVPFNSQPPPKQNIVETRLAEETSGRYVGPMPVADFLKTFLDVELESDDDDNNNNNSDLSGTFNGIPPSPEIDMYGPFVKAIAPHVAGFDVVDSSSSVNQVEIGAFTLKPDLTLYKQGSPRQGATDFSAMEMWIEFKANLADEPFSDTGDFEKDTIKGRLTRGQLTSYGLAQLGSQFRNFAFSVFIMRDRARLMRWDRAGVVITCQFNYVAEPQILVDFFQRFSKLSDEDRGLDTTVTVADEEHDVPADVLLNARKALGIPEKPLFRIAVANDHPDEGANNSPQLLHYIGPRSACPSVSLIGRATRGWPVYNPVTNEVVFLKDTWRIDSGDIEPEGKTYRTLHSKRVKNIARFQRGGDVGSTTRTQTFTTTDWSHVKNDVTGHINYRLVLEDVGKRLAVQSTKQLVKVIRDAMEAHWLACCAGVLHRDISPGNVVIFVDEDGNARGLLIDWDLSKEISKTKKRRPDRTGTWQFMSAALLRDRHKVQDLTDDLESFLHVLMWMTIRYVPSNLSPEQRNKYLKTMFDEYYQMTEGPEGGDSKGDKLGAKNYIPAKLTLNSPSPLLGILNQLSDVFIAIYGPNPTERDVQVFESILQSPLSEFRETILQNHVCYLHQQRLERSKDSTWFINTMEEALGNEHWPDQDASNPNLLSPSDGTSTARQMALNANKIASNEQRSIASYYPSGCSHSSKRGRSPSFSVPDTDGTNKRSRSNTLAPDHASDDS
ncbi:hypothetical protein BU15DRAFT_55848 [Melanogaster broomeanus]|nr:hypothetical protein BU15DRAFT_55848 [Melanogaster broomeanus]